MENREFGLIGRGISHSFSSGFFNNKFEEEGLDCEYLNFDLADVGQLPGIIIHHPLLMGLNVTSPYKRAVLDFLNTLSEEAAALQAANVIKIERVNGKVEALHGYNTDAEGFRQTLEGLVPKGVRALVLGTGGASSAVCYALSKEGIPYKVVSRTPNGEEISYPEASSLIPEYGMIINATPLGMHPNTETFPNLDYEKITAGHICYDLIYNPAETLFLKKASERGAKTVNGLQMLVNQAILSWKIWTS